MTGVPTIHQTLGDIDADSGRVNATVNVRDRAHRAAVHPHAHREIGIMFQNAADLYRALDRLLGAILKNERHTVPRRNFPESPRGSCSTELVRAANRLVELVDEPLLFIRRAGGITNDVDKQNVRDFEPRIRLRYFRHAALILRGVRCRLKRFRV